ncbi:MAG: diacylglycerol kinase [Cellvibrionales bacterium]|nr:diacylglycerol kinase [Cellvibrionales bacterium]
MQTDPSTGNNKAQSRTSLGLNGLRRILRATRYSLQGLRAAWRHEPSFRQEISVICILVPLSIYLASSVHQWLWMLLSCTLVVLTELLNSAIEAAVDRTGPEQHELSGRAKDLGSAAVFVALTFFFVVWSLAVVDRFFYDFWAS